MQDFIGSSEYIPTRSTKAAPKVAYNPMQFVKTGPTKLAKTAQEQLKKAEEVKKVRETKKDDAEDWQSVNSFHSPFISIAVFSILSFKRIWKDGSRVGGSDRST